MRSFLGCYWIFILLIKVLYKHIAYDSFWSLTPNYINNSLVQTNTRFHFLLPAILLLCSDCQRQHFKYDHLFGFKQKNAKSRCKTILIISNQPPQRGFLYKYWKLSTCRNTVLLTLWEATLFTTLVCARTKTIFVPRDLTEIMLASFWKGSIWAKPPRLHRHNNTTELEGIILLPIQHLQSAKALKLEIPWCW